jgi:hypothetical protein
MRLAVLAKRSKESRCASLLAIAEPEFVLDFEVFTMRPPSPPKDADFRLVHELHRRLVAAE